ncbi:acyl transferase/acyl hydrolase/lysophospholipase [Pyronema omphalodes]|nr:acyl transferase/acyl hydrolase/lysophospholipase [Pyronema omphalodes]
MPIVLAYSESLTLRRRLSDTPGLLVTEMAHIMRQSQTRGLRLLSLDGGGIRGISELLILEEIMIRIKDRQGLEEVPRPHQYFDLIGGTSTGGLIALMLGRLQMSVADAIAAYSDFSKYVFSERKHLFQEGYYKATKLEEAVKKVVKLYGESWDGEEDMLDTREDSQVCKAFVCAVSANNIGRPTLFRTYRVPTSSPMCKIWQAARATTAAPTFFKSISIGAPGSEVRYVDAGLGCNNPTRVLLDEAGHLFRSREIDCIVSIGTGHQGCISLSEPTTVLQKIWPLMIIEVLKRLATDATRVAEEVGQSFADRPNRYFRFNVHQGMQAITLEEWQKLSEVRAHTEQYLREVSISRDIDTLVDVIIGGHTAANHPASPRVEAAASNLMRNVSVSRYRGTAVEASFIEQQQQPPPYFEVPAMDYQDLWHQIPQRQHSGTEGSTQRPMSRDSPSVFPISPPRIQLQQIHELPVLKPHQLGHEAPRPSTSSEYTQPISRRNSTSGSETWPQQSQQSETPQVQQPQTQRLSIQHPAFHLLTPRRSMSRIHSDPPVLRPSLPISHTWPLQTDQQQVHELPVQHTQFCPARPNPSVPSADSSPVTPHLSRSISLSWHPKTPQEEIYELPTQQPHNYPLTPRPSISSTHSRPTTPPPSTDYTVPELRLSFVTAEEQMRCAEMFNSAIEEGEKALSSAAARTILDATGLPLSDLVIAWELSDTTRSGSLFFPEFVLAMYFCRMRQQGQRFPNCLPERMKSEVENMIEIITFVPRYKRLSFVSQSTQTRIERTFRAEVQGEQALCEFRAQEILLKSGLPPTELPEILKLADTTKSGSLLFPQFVLAMYLCTKRKRGEILPKALHKTMLDEVSSMVDSISFGVDISDDDSSARFSWEGDRF